AVMLLLVRDGPHVQARAAFHPRAIVELVRSRPIVLANLGYFGHMWELYAMWTWIGLYLLEALTAAGVAGPAAARAPGPPGRGAGGGRGSARRPDRPHGDHHARHDGERAVRGRHRLRLPPADPRGRRGPRLGSD